MLQSMQASQQSVIGLLGMTGTALRSFGWRPKQVPFKDWKIVRGDQVSKSLQIWCNFTSCIGWSDLGPLPEESRQSAQGLPEEQLSARLRYQHEIQASRWRRRSHQEEDSIARASNSCLERRPDWSWSERADQDSNRLPWGRYQSASVKEVRRHHSQARQE